MTAGQVLDAPSWIQLDGEEYMLLRGDLAEELQNRTGARRWTVTSKRIAAQIVPSRNLRQGEIRDEYLYTIEARDWAQGQSGSRGLPGQCQFAFSASAIFGGPSPTVGGLDIVSTDAQIASPATLLLFNGLLFLIAGRYAYRGTAVATMTQDRDFGAGIYATDAIVHNNELVVCFGGATNKIQKRDTAANWTTATDAVYADHFAHVQDRLWRATATNQVGNIGPTDNPFTLSLWSNGTPVGAADIGVTDLNGYGIQLAVSKPEGLFLGDSGQIFPNVLAQFESAPAIDNGKNTVIRGSDIFYPHQDGLLRRYGDGRLEEVGLQAQIMAHAPLATNSSDPDAFIPSTSIDGLTAAGHHLWAACAPPNGPWIKPTVMFTTDNGASYTNRTTQVTDGDSESTCSLNLDTVANGDWLLIGTASGVVANGFFFDALVANTATATMTVSYWDGAAWVDYGPTTRVMLDRTASGGLSAPSSAPTITLSRSGMILFPGGTQPTLSTINSLSRHWWRISFSAALSSTCVVGEVRAIGLRTSPLNSMGCMLYRLRPVQASDDPETTTKSLVWEPYSFLHLLPNATAVLYYDSRYPPYGSDGNLAVFGLNNGILFAIPGASQRPYMLTEALTGVASYWVTPLLDGAMPDTNKQWLRLRIRSLFSDSATLSFATRTDDTAAWSSETTITSDDFSVALSGISGRRISIRFRFGTGSFQPGNDNMPMILGFSLVYRALETYVREYSAILLVADNLPSSGGGELWDASTQITNLEALRGTAAKTLIDPIQQSKTVSILDVNILEAYQLGQNWPALAVLVRMAEE